MQITVASWFDKSLSTAKRVISISVSEPKGRKFNAKIEELVPPWDLVDQYKKKLISEEEYRDIYVLKVAPKLDDAIAKIQDGDWLCCWEKTGNFCHRLIVADMLQHRGIEVTRK